MLHYQSNIRENWFIRNISHQEMNNQGGILRSVLFNIILCNYIIPLLHEGDSQPPSLLEKQIGYLLYPDDLVNMTRRPSAEFEQI